MFPPPCPIKSCFDLLFPNELLHLNQFSRNVLCQREQRAMCIYFLTLRVCVCFCYIYISTSLSEKLIFKASFYCHICAPSFFSSSPALGHFFVGVNRCKIKSIISQMLQIVLVKKEQKNAVAFAVVSPPPLHRFKPSCCSEILN